MQKCLFAGSVPLCVLASIAYVTVLLAKSGLVITPHGLPEFCHQSCMVDCHNSCPINKSLSQLRRCAQATSYPTHLLLLPSKTIVETTDVRYLNEQLYRCVGAPRDEAKNESRLTQAELAAPKLHGLKDYI